MLKTLVIVSIFISLMGNYVFANELDDANAKYESEEYAVAFSMYKNLASNNDSYAQYRLGVMYDNGISVLENDKEAVKWYTLAAEQGEVRAQSNLGVMYDDGEGVPENDEVAVKWYTLAAEQGYVEAQINLGFMHAMGDGVPESSEKAVKW